MTLAKLRLYEAGFCVHPQHVVLQNWRFSNLRFPSMFALIEHPTAGVILYDTGYSHHFIEETRAWPNRLYAMATPVNLRSGRSAKGRLRRDGIDASDVRYVICSHFHADHISALADFPNAKYVFLDGAWRAVKHLTGIPGLLKAFLPGLIPPDFERRMWVLEHRDAVALPGECAPFDRGIDLFGDGSVYGVPLPGHAVGQLGLFVPTQHRSYFLVADACWTSDSYRAQVLPTPATKILFESTRIYQQTLAKIHALSCASPEIEIVPSHCDEVLSRLGQ